MQIQIHDAVTPALRAFAARLGRPRVLLQAGAKAVEVALKQHLKQLQARGNAKGWPSQKFFSGKATSVSKSVGLTELTDTTATVSITDARFIHRIQGGTITAKRGAALAIPLTAEAASYSGKGSLRQSCPGLFLVRTKKGAFLARSLFEKRAGGKDQPQRQQLRFLFILKKSVTQRPHPEDLPDVEQLRHAATLGMETAANRLVQG